MLGLYSGSGSRKRDPTPVMSSEKYDFGFRGVSEVSPRGTISVHVSLCPKKSAFDVLLCSRGKGIVSPGFGPAFRLYSFIFIALSSRKTGQIRPHDLTKRDMAVTNGTDSAPQPSGQEAMELQALRPQRKIPGVHPHFTPPTKSRGGRHACHSAFSNVVYFCYDSCHLGSGTGDWNSYARKWRHSPGLRTSCAR